MPGVGQSPAAWVQAMASKVNQHWMKHSPLLGPLGLLIVDDDPKLLELLIDELDGTGHPYII